MAFLSLIPSMLAQSCLPLTGDWIRAGDLAPHIAAFAKVNASQVLTPAPLGTTRRWLRRSELERWLQKLGILEPVESDICAARVSKRIGSEELKTAMQQALGEETAHIEIIDRSGYEVPEGRLEFKLSGLAGSAATRHDQPVLWKGKVVSESGRSFPVWARVRVSVERVVPVAARAIRAGEKLGAEDLAFEKRRLFPHAKQYPGGVAAVAGRVALCRLAAGDVIAAEKLKRPREVSPGDLVEAEASGGTVRLRFTAKAETAGDVGDRIWLKALGGKRIAALLTAPGQAQVMEVEK